MTNTYDAQGRVATQKDARGLLTGEPTTFDYTSVPSTTIVTYPPSSADPSWSPKVEDTYDADGRLVRQVSKPTANPAEHATVESTYNAAGFRSSVRDARGNTTDFCYDVDYAGVAITTTRGLLTRRIDPPPTPGANRPVTLLKYDARNNLVQTTPPKGVTSGPTVTCATNLSGSLNQLSATDLTYDAATLSQLEAITQRFTDPELGQQTATTKLEYAWWNPPGLVSTLIPPRGNTGPSPDYSYATSFVYYAAELSGLLESVTDPLGNKTSYRYDLAGRRIAMVDPNGNAGGAVPAEHTWEDVYDQEDRLRSTKAPAPAPGGSPLVTEFRYDPAGNRQVVLDANGQVTKYLYDERDSLFQVLESPSVWTDPATVPTDTITTEYRYDGNGNLTRALRARGTGRACSTRTGRRRATATMRSTG